jgi:SAM-dependent methyltransferase
VGGGLHKVSHGIWSNKHEGLGLPARDDSRRATRLSKLNKILNEASLRELRLGSGERILDVGCGLAQLPRRMARTAGRTGRVVGIERSADFEIYVENMIGILRGVKEKMLNFGLLDARTFEVSVAALRDWKHRPDAALWFAMAWAEGARRK